MPQFSITCQLEVLWMEWVKGPKVSNIPFFCTQLTEGQTYKFLSNIITPHKNISSMTVKPYKYSYISLQFNNTHSFLRSLMQNTIDVKKYPVHKNFTYIWEETVIYGAASLRLIHTCLQVGSNNFKSVIVQGVWDDLLLQSLDVLTAVVHRQRLKGICLFNDISSLHYIAPNGRMILELELDKIRPNLR